MLNLKISQCTDPSRVPELIKHCNSVYDELRRDAMAQKPDGTRWQYNDLYKNPLEIQNFIKNNEMFVAEIDGCLAGCMRIICDEQRGSSSFQTLAVGPEFRGKKIAGKLVAFAENLSKSKGYRFIECDAQYGKTKKKRAKTQKKISWVFQVKNTKKRHLKLVSVYLRKILA